ncbi:protein of unknown function [Pseudomonas sp. JV241A]|nr:protein of unknown function [Pseudomonas sp. JV241A]
MLTEWRAFSSHGATVPKAYSVICHWLWHWRSV